MKNVLLYSIILFLFSCSAQTESKSEKPEQTFQKFDSIELKKLKKVTDSILENGYLCQTDIRHFKKLCVSKGFFSNDYPNLYCGISGNDSLYFFSSFQDSKALGHSFFSVESNNEKLLSNANKTMINNLEMNYNAGKVYEESFHDEISCNKIIKFFKSTNEKSIKLKLYNFDTFEEFQLNELDIDNIKKTISLQEKLRLISQNSK